MVCEANICSNYLTSLFSLLTKKLVLSMQVLYMCRTQRLVITVPADGLRPLGSPGSPGTSWSVGPTFAQITWCLLFLFLSKKLVLKVWVSELVITVPADGLALIIGVPGSPGTWWYIRPIFAQIIRYLLFIIPSWQINTSSVVGYVCIGDSKLVITVPADGLAP